MDTPEVRQNTDPDSDTFGTVAVRRGDDEWGLMNPGVVNSNARGGHWGTDAEVAGWTPGTFTPAPEQPAEAPAQAAKPTK